MMMKIKNVKVDWEYQKDRLKEKFSNLTDRDLYFKQGEMEAMLTKLQDKLGKTRHELYTIIARL
jgi:uncharacterized protein YjbJ (UPF0337 family)